MAFFFFTFLSPVTHLEFFSLAYPIPLHISVFFSGNTSSFSFSLLFTREHSHTLVRSNYLMSNNNFQKVVYMLALIRFKSGLPFLSTHYRTVGRACYTYTTQSSPGSSFASSRICANNNKNSSSINKERKEKRVQVCLRISLCHW